MKHHYGGITKVNTLIQEEVPDPTTLLFGEALSLLLTQNERLAERKELRVCEQGRGKQSGCARKRQSR